MIRTMFAMAVAALVFAAVSGTSQAAPIAPLPGAVSTDAGGVTPVYYHRYYHRLLPSALASLLVAPRLSRLRLIGILSFGRGR